MKRFPTLSPLLLGAVFTILVFWGTAQAEEPVKEAGEGELVTISVHPVGDVHDGEVKRVVAFLKRESRAEVVVGKHVEPAGDTLKEQSTAVAEALPGVGEEGRSYLTILLSRVQPKDPSHAMLDPTNKIMVVNLVSLQDENKELAMQRVERHALRAFAFSAGLGPCIYPRCALYRYKNLSALDTSARNCCPPCGQQLDQALKKKGLKVGVRKELSAQQLEKLVPPPAPAVPAPVSEK